MDEQNPAVSRQTGISPAFLEEVGKDPKAISALMRKMLLIQAHQMHVRMRDANAPLNAKQAFIEWLAKVGDVVPKQVANGSASGPGFSVNIVLSGKDHSKAALPMVEVVDNKENTDE